MVGGKLEPQWPNADDTIEDTFAAPDPTLTNFLVAAGYRGHHLAAMVLEHVRTSDKDGHEIASLLAQVTDDVKGDTMLNFVNMIS